MLKGNEIPTETHRACYHIRDLTDIKELRIKINPHYKLVSQVKLFLKSCFGLRYSFSHLENTLHTIPWHWVNPMDVIANKVKISSPLCLEIIFLSRICEASKISMSNNISRIQWIKTVLWNMGLWSYSVGTSLA